jgi:hypothetical protein
VGAFIRYRSLKSEKNGEEEPQRNQYGIEHAGRSRRHRGYKQRCQAQNSD